MTVSVIETVPALRCFQPLYRPLPTCVFLSARIDQIMCSDQTYLLTPSACHLIALHIPVQTSIQSSTLSLSCPVTHLSYSIPPGCPSLNPATPSPSRYSQRAYLTPSPACALHKTGCSQQCNNSREEEKLHPLLLKSYVPIACTIIHD